MPGLMNARFDIFIGDKSSEATFKLKPHTNRRKIEKKSLTGEELEELFNPVVVWITI